MKMEKLITLLNHLEPILKADNEELKGKLGDAYTGDQKQDLVKRVSRWEKVIARKYREQRKKYQQALNGYVQKAVKLEDLVKYLDALDKKNEFGDPKAMQLTFQYMFSKDMSELSEVYLTALPTSKTNKKNKPLHFKQFDKGTLTWIENWSQQLADLMHLSNKNAVEDAISEGLKNGWDIPKIAKELRNDPAFSRKRAKVTAITEVLTANTASQFEAYKQSPVVSGKKWKHSGARKITPRPYHLHQMDGQEVKVEEGFHLREFRPMFPRDPLLPPSERVSCHCAMGPVTDDSFLDAPYEQQVEKQDTTVTKDFRVAHGVNEFKRIRGKKDHHMYEDHVFEECIRYFNGKGYTPEQATNIADEMSKIRRKWTASSTNKVSIMTNNFLADLIERKDLEIDSEGEGLTKEQQEAVLFIHYFTLKELKNADVTHIKIYRGIKLGGYTEYPEWMPKDVDKPTVVTGRAIQSWSMELKKAEEFANLKNGEGEFVAGAIFETDIPIERVFATYDFAEEKEIVPLGDVENVTVTLSKVAQEMYNRTIKKGTYKPWMTTTKIPEEFDDWLKELRKKNGKKK